MTRRSEYKPTTAKIIEIIGVEKSKKHVVIHAMTDEGDIVKGWWGGEVELWWDEQHGVTKAFVKRKDETKL